MTMSEKIQSSLDALREDVRDLKDHVQGLIRRKKDAHDTPSEEETGLAQWTWPGWPQVDVQETDDQFTVTVDLPGLTKDDVDVHVDRNRLMLGASHETSREQDEDGWVRRERISGSFTRTLRLPCEVDVDSCDANMKNGVLRVELKKREGGRTSRRVKVA